MKIALRLNFGPIGAFVTKLRKWITLKRFLGLLVVIVALAMVITTITIAIFYKPKTNANRGSSASNIALVTTDTADTTTTTLNDTETVAHGVGGCTGAKGCPIITFSATPATTPAGTESTLIWTTTGSPTSCEASGDWSGTKTAAGSQSTGSLTDPRAYSYTLTCKNAAGEGFSTLSVSATAVQSGGTGSVADRPDVFLSAVPTTVIQGTSTNLSWSLSGNPTACDASGAWGGSKATTDSSQDSPPLNTLGQAHFILKCSNSAGYKQVDVPVTVIAPPPKIPILSLTGPANAVTGDTLSFTYSANNATSCTASGAWLITVSLDGQNHTVTQTAQAANSDGTVKNYDYTLTCFNGTNSTNPTTISVSVLPKAPALTVSLANIPSNGTAPTTSTTVITGAQPTVYYRVTNGTPLQSCTLSGNNVTANSTLPSSSVAMPNPLTSTPSPALFATNDDKHQDFTLKITCLNSNGSASGQVSVRANPVAPAVTLSGNASASVSTPYSASWSATDTPTSCTPTSTNLTASNWESRTFNLAPTNGTASGTASVTFTKTGSITLYLQCYNDNGTAIASNKAALVISVTNSAVPPSVTFTPLSATVGSGQTTTFGWSTTGYSTNAYTCAGTGGIGTWTSETRTSATVSTGNYGSLTNAGATDITVIFTLSCTDSVTGLKGSGTFTVTVKPAPTLTLTSSPALPATVNYTSAATANFTLTWTVKNGNTANAGATCTASPAITPAGRTYTVITGTLPAPPTTVSGNSNAGLKFANNSTVGAADITTNVSFVFNCKDSYNNTISQTLSGVLTEKSPTSCGGYAGTCAGVSMLAAHASTTTGCWAYALTPHSTTAPYTTTGNSYATIYSMQALVGTQHAGGKGINTAANCGIDITTFLNGNAKAPGSSGKHGHSTSELNKYASQTFIGYYDPSVP